jgi:hypothetical protein
MFYRLPADVNCWGWAYPLLRIRRNSGNHWRLLGIIWRFVRFMVIVVLQIYRLTVPLHEQGLKLLALQGGFAGFHDQIHSCHQGIRFLNGVILAERNEINMFSHQ